MAQSTYRTSQSYVIFAEDSAFGTPGTPAGGSYLDKVASWTGNILNNPILVQGIGDGVNATHVINGPLDVNGDVEFELTDPAFLQYMFIGTLAGAGTSVDPYEIQEANAIGYASGEVNTLTVEAGKEGGSNDDVITYDGVHFNTVTVSGEVGNTIKVSGNWVGRSATSSTAIENYAGPTNRPFTWVDSSVVVGSDVAAQVQSFSITCGCEFAERRELGNRFILTPTLSKRRYTFSVTMRLHFNDGFDILSGRDIRALVMNGATGTSPSATAENTTSTLRFKLVEGASSGDRVVWFELGNAYFGDISEPIQVDNGDIIVTVNGVALSGLLDSTVYVPVRYWTI